MNSAVLELVAKLCDTPCFLLGLRLELFVVPPRLNCLLGSLELLDRRRLQVVLERGNCPLQLVDLLVGLVQPLERIPQSSITTRQELFALLE